MPAASSDATSLRFSPALNASPSPLRRMGSPRASRESIDNPCHQPRTEGVLSGRAHRKLNHAGLRCFVMARPTRRPMPCRRGRRPRAYASLLTAQSCSFAHAASISGDRRRRVREEPRTSRPAEVATTSVLPSGDRGRPASGRRVERRREERRVRAIRSDEDRLPLDDGLESARPPRQRERVRGSAARARAAIAQRWRDRQRHVAHVVTARERRVQRHAVARVVRLDPSERSVGRRRPRQATRVMSSAEASSPASGIDAHHARARAHEELAARLERQRAPRRLVTLARLRDGRDRRGPRARCAAGATDSIHPRASVTRAGVRDAGGRSARSSASAARSASPVVT